MAPLSHRADLLSCWVSLVSGVMSWWEGQQFTLYSNHQTASTSQSNYILLWWRNCKPGGRPRAQAKKTHMCFHFRCLKASELIHAENLSLTTSKITCSSSCRRAPDKKNKMTPFKLTVTKTDQILINPLCETWAYYSLIKNTVDCVRLNRSIHIWRHDLVQELYGAQGRRRTGPVAKLPNRWSLVWRSWVALWWWKGNISLCWPIDWPLS